MAKKEKIKYQFADRIAILGAGNIGQAMAKGLILTGGYKHSQVYLTRRRVKALEDLKQQGFAVSGDNAEAVTNCKTVIIAVQPDHLDSLLDSIRSSVKLGKHLVLSTITGVSTAEINRQLGGNISIIRIMPNTAVAIGESMTCLAADNQNGRPLRSAVKLFDKLGKTLVIPEEDMIAATALCACGVAFFLRSIRASSQGGIQIGFHAEEALRMAAQTARGAASLLLKSNIHPESEIDKVTTPRGCTIAGLNRMEHEGFSSAMIQGLVTATEIASSLFLKDK
jgi:pyrroline-5-carboxylate reductase